MRLSVGFLSCSIGLYFCFVPVQYCLDDCSLVVWSKVRKVDSSGSVFLSKDCLGYLDLLCFHMNCGSFCSSSVKNAFSNLMGNALNPNSNELNLIGNAFDWECFG